MDEMATNNTALSPRYAYSPKGRRAYDARVPRNRGANTALLASMSLEGMGPCLAAEDPTSTTVFEAYVEKALAPGLRPGQIGSFKTLTLVLRFRKIGLKQLRNYTSSIS